MIHTHSFLALGLISAAAMLGTLYHARKKDMFTPLVNFLCYGGIAVIMALPQLLTWTFPQTVGGGSLAIRPNWVNWNGHGLIDEYFWFWIKNVGLVYLVMLPAGLMAKRRGKLFALGALFIYLIAELIQFQPNPYDNNKLFYVAYMVMLPLCAQYLIALYDRIRDLPGRRILACAFIAVSVLSGVLSVMRECVSEYQLYGASDLRAVEFIKSESEEFQQYTGDTVVLTGTQHNNPVSSVGGMKIVCGTSSFLYYHGVNYYAQERDVKKMYESPIENAYLFEQYGVDYIYISSSERYNYAIDFAAISANYPLVHDGGTQVYAVSEAARAAAERND
jgi:hypothetical protein